MRYGILGAVEVRHDGRPFSVGGPQQRALLAALLVSANRVVSTDRLIEYLWAENPPAAARSLLQGCVAQLRRACRAADPGWRRLHTRPPGYLLEVSPGELDLERFEALVASAADGDPAKAAAVLAEALALWRGPALDGVDVDAARADAAGLEERRMAAVEQRCEAELRLARYPALIAGLEAEVRAHPLRERLWTLLMLAQCGDDRRADALATYRRLRRITVDELGMEPGPGVQDLQATILSGGDALAAYRIMPAPSVPVPAQLPPAVTGFTGRAEHLAALDELLSTLGETTAIGVVSGGAGIGKTALAVHWGHRAASRFPGGRLYVNLQGYGVGSPARPIDALAAFLEAFGVKSEQIPTDPERATATYRSLVAGRRLLVVLDNAHSAEQVRPLLPGGPGNLVLITSRDRLGGLVARDGARPIVLDPLPPGDAVTLIARVLGAERAGAEPDGAAELARLCGHLPLALRIAAANLACQPDRRIADEVAALSAGDRLSGLAVEGDRESAVRAAFDQSYLVLTPAERTLFGRLGLVSGPDVSAEAAAALSGTEVADVAPALERLVRASLIQPLAPGRYALHDLLRLYAAEKAGGDEEAVGRLFEWYQSSCEAAARALYPGKLRLPRPDPPAAFDSAASAVAWLDAERANLVAATLRGRRPAAWILADSLRGYLWLRMYLVDWEQLATAGLAAATAAGDLPGQAACHLSLADLIRCQGRYDVAIDHYQQAAAVAGRAAWPEALLAALGNLGTAYFWRGDLAVAAEHYTRGLEIARGNGREAAQAVRLGNLGLVYWLLGRFAEAADLQARALALHRRLGDRGNQGIDLANLGECRYALGDLDQARTHLTDALAIHVEVGARSAEAETRAVLAGVEREAGRLDTALDLAVAAVALARETGDRPIVANVLTVLAAVHDAGGDRGRAAALYAEALEFARETGTRHAELAALVGLSLTTGDPGHAERALATAGDYHVLRAHAHAALATLTGDTDHGRAALAIYQASGYHAGTTRMTALLAPGGS